ncbi:MAG: ArgE/DapE family deacylase [Tannerellaceae bacterium]|nr:ArgE/DapE family deacylase [Tannerellaceae bacterium]
MEYEPKEITWLKDILRMDSTTGNEKIVADYLTSILQNAGIATRQIEYAPGRNQLIATLNGTTAGNILGVSGHMDVVPVGNVPWQHAPFSAVEENGKIYGRGASDMKAGLVAAVAAMVKLKEQNVPLKGAIRLLATIGEETGAIGARQLTELGYVDDLDALIIREPTGNHLVTSHKGVIWLKLETTGQTAHGSAPQLGVNAIDHMLYFLDMFRKKINLAKYSDHILGVSTASLNVLQGGNSTNVVPDHCLAELDIRTVPELDHTHLIEELQELGRRISKKTKNFHIKIDITNDLPALQTDFNDPFVQLAAKTTTYITGQEQKEIGSPGYTDGSQFSMAKKRFPVILLGPGTGEMAHQPDEYVIIKDYLDSISIYEYIAREFLK